MVQPSAGEMGTFIAIGGHENKSGDMAVLKRVLQEAKGSQSRVHIITTAGTLPEEYKKMYEDAFRLLGVECVVTYIATREEANDPQIVSRIADADVIFFSGGDQSRLPAILGGTAFLDEVMRLFRQGTVLAGTSAGAAASSAMMIYPDGKGGALLKTGLGFVPGVVFDTHFDTGKRLTRLFNVITAKPKQGKLARLFNFLTAKRSNIGIGLDENTAVVMHNKNMLEVVGSGCVTIIDGKSLQQKLVAGDRYNLKKRKIIPA